MFRKLITSLGLLALVLSFGQPTAAQTANLAECVTQHDATKDYFPEKTTIQYAKGLEVQYFKSYKVVKIGTPWGGAKEGFEYVLVQCGTPAPKAGDPGVSAKSALINIPIKSIIPMSTTYLPALDKLGVAGTIKGLDSFLYANTPSVVKLIEDKKLVEIGSGATVNLEALIVLKPDLVMTFGSGSAEYDTHPKLAEGKITHALNADFMETTPLGRAEWIKYLALFYNLEGKAESIFKDTVSKYQKLSTLTESVKTRPTVLINAPYQGTWYLSGGKSFQSALIADAGGAYLWADDQTSGTLVISFEAVFQKAGKADFWINAGFPTREAALKQDSRYGDFAAFVNGKVWNNDVRVNKNFGNDYFESGVANPDVVLADLIKIFHPDLIKDHTFVYYQPMGK
jgi:iron complex transport system substrate-binding protein